MPAQRLGVIVVEPLSVVRAAMVRLIDDDPDIDVLAQAGTADEALEEIGRMRQSPVSALVDLGLEGEHDAYWLITAIHERFPAASILACGANADALSISRALFSGADGFLDKSSNPTEFVRSIVRGATGEMALVGRPREWVGAIAGSIERRHLVETALTDREREVLLIAAEGLTARQIAARLGVRERTVTTHLTRIYSKLGVATRLAAIRLATDAGLVSGGTAE